MRRTLVSHRRAHSCKAKSAAVSVGGSRVLLWALEPHVHVSLSNIGSTSDMVDDYGHRPAAGHLTAGRHMSRVKFFVPMAASL